MSSEIYSTITDKIAAAIEAGAGQCRMPWHTDGSGSVQPVNLAGRRYRGMNTILLWCEAQAKGYENATWGTYKSFQQRGAQVRRGEKSSLVVFWKSFPVQVTDDSGDIRSETRLVARGYHVFNVAQVDGYHIKGAALPELPIKDRIAHAESFFGAIRAEVRHGGNRAFCSRATGHIQLPEFERFNTAEDYYSTRGHETVHWSGHPGRLDREFGKRFGDDAYAFEELVAELGAAFLCGHLALSNEPRPDHAQYLAGWLRALKNDKRAIFTAASKAQAAADYLVKLAGGSVETEESELALAA